MRLIDTHSHIHDTDFDADRDAVIARAQESGVELIVSLGVDAANSRLAVALAERSSAVLAAVGVHPHEAGVTTGDQLDALEALTRHQRVALVGEIGLDFYRNLSPRDQQVRVLRRQLLTASRAAKPIAVHSRNADEDMTTILTAWSHEMGGRLPGGRPLGVMHYFSGNVDMAHHYVDLGFMISIHTSITHPKASSLVEVAREVGIEHLVLETDSPYGAPRRYRGQRNEPAHVADAAACVAELKGVSIEVVAEATTRNARRLLGIRDALDAGADCRSQSAGRR